jgi:small subunit ribosomal protein S2
MPCCKGKEQGLAQPSLKELIEAGAHYGHQTRRWNPKMRRFIFGKRNGLYIIDLAKTMQQLRDAVEVVKKVAAERKSILFVGTKKQAQAVIQECAEQCGEFYVCERWLGGALTNMTTIRQSVKKMERIEKQIGTESELMSKKELSRQGKLLGKLERNLSGIRAMRRLPALMVVVDSTHERIAVAEAKRLGIPVMGLVDTNCDPDPIDYVIACNDDSLKSIKLILQSLADAICEVKASLEVAEEKEGPEQVEEENSEEMAKLMEGDQA